MFRMTILDTIFEAVVGFIPSLILAVVGLVLGLFCIKYIVKGTRIILRKRNVDVTLRRFTLSAFAISLKIILFITIISILGVQTTSIIAFLGALGFAIGLALQGGLSNFAGGILILIFKPFKVGDFISANGTLGTIEAIDIFNTTLKTPDGIFMYIPNGTLSNTAITNFSKHETRRIDVTITISYEDEIAKAKKIILDILSTEKRILKEPQYSVVVSELGESAVHLKVRAWVNGKDWWTTQTDLFETIKTTFDKKNITIPYPQRTVHMVSKR